MNRTPEQVERDYRNCRFAPDEFDEIWTKDRPAVFTLSPVYRCSGFVAGNKECADCPKGDKHTLRTTCKGKLRCEWRADHPLVECVEVKDEA